MVKKVIYAIVPIILVGVICLVFFGKPRFYTKGAEQLYNVLNEQKSDDYDIYISQGSTSICFITAYEKAYNWDEIFEIKANMENFINQNKSLFGSIDNISMKIAVGYDSKSCDYPYVKFYNSPQNIGKLDRMEINDNISSMRLEDTLFNDVGYIWIEHGFTYDFTVELFEHFPYLETLYISSYYVDDYEKLKEALPYDCEIELI